MDQPTAIHIDDVPLDPHQPVHMLIRQARAQLGLTRGTICAMTGLSKDRVKHLLCEQHRPRHDSPDLVKLREALCIPDDVWAICFAEHLARNDLRPPLQTYTPEECDARNARLDAIGRVLSRKTRLEAVITAAQRELERCDHRIAYLKGEPVVPEDELTGEAEEAA